MTEYSCTLLGLEPDRLLHIMLLFPPTKVLPHNAPYFLLKGSVSPKRSKLKCLGNHAYHTEPFFINQSKLSDRI